MATGRCSVIVALGGQPAGYGVLDYSFYESRFVSLIDIDPAHRCQGAGRLLMRHLEGLCQTPQLDYIQSRLSRRVA